MGSSTPAASQQHSRTASCPCCCPVICSSPASSSSCAGAWTPGSSPPARRWGRSAGGPSADTRTHGVIPPQRIPRAQSRSSERAGRGTVVLTLGTKPGSRRFWQTSPQGTAERYADVWMSARQEKRCSGFTVSSCGTTALL